MTFQDGLGFIEQSYFTSALPFINHYRLASGWVLANKSATPEAIAASLDANGQPTGATAEPVQIAVPLSRVAESYDVIVKGDISRIYFGLSGKNLTYNPAVNAWQGPVPGGQYSLLIVYPKGTGKFTIEAIVRTSQRARYDKGETWNPEFAAAVRGFSPKRFMDWNLTNAKTYPAVRSKPTDPSFYGKGIAIELQADLCNQDGSAMWLNVHHTDTVDQMREKVAAADKVLGAGQALLVEFSNENPWNGAFPGSQVSIASGNPDKFFAEKCAVLAGVCASVGPRPKIVLAGQFGWLDRFKGTVAFYKAAGGSMDQVACISGAPYVEPLKTFNGRALDDVIKAGDKAAFMDNMRAAQAAMVPTMAKWAAYAKELGKPVLCYEWNQSLYAGSDALRATRAAFYPTLAHSEEMATLLMKHRADMIAAGFAGACFYGDFGAGANDGFWGMGPDSSSPLYPIGRMLRAEVDTAAKVAVASTTDELVAIYNQLGSIIARINAG